MGAQPKLSEIVAEARMGIQEAVDLGPYLNRASERELVRLRAHRAEADRYRGVAPSGMAPEPFKAKTAAELLAEARAEKARAEAHAQTNRGKAQAALNAGQRLAERLHAALEDVRAAMSRDDGTAKAKTEPLGEIVRDLRLKVGDLESFIGLMAAEAEAPPTCGELERRHGLA